MADEQVEAPSPANFLYARLEHCTKKKTPGGNIVVILHGLGSIPVLMEAVTVENIKLLALEHGYGELSDEEAGCCVDIVQRLPIKSPIGRRTGFVSRYRENMPPRI